MFYWPAQLVFWANAVIALLLGGLPVLIGYIIGSIITSFVIAWQLLSADAIRPKAEWSDEPVPSNDWVL